VKRAIVLVGAAALVAAGGVAGWFAARETQDPDVVVETATVTETQTVRAPEPGVPEAVALTRDALLEAARERDYDALLKRTTDEEPLEQLEQILELPYTLSRGIYVWPFAYDVESLGDLTAYERELLAPLGPLETVFVEGTGYLGWRAGIRPDGTWVFFVAGD
jgi:hypothetical protein